MKVYEVIKGSTSLDGLRKPERPEPQPGWHEVLIRVRATSINYRDHMVVMGRYFSSVDPDTVPLSDGAGEVVSVGPGVARFKIGDRVAGTFFQVKPGSSRPQDGQRSLRYRFSTRQPIAAPRRELVEV